jgi:hypothetical protein
VNPTSVYLCVKTEVAKGNPLKYYIPAIGNGKPKSYFHC